MTKSQYVIGEESNIYVRIVVPVRLIWAYNPADISDTKDWPGQITSKSSPTRTRTSPWTSVKAASAFLVGVLMTLTGISVTDSVPASTLPKSKEGLMSIISESEAASGKQGSQFTSTAKPDFGTRESMTSAPRHNTVTTPRSACRTGPYSTIQISRLVLNE